MQLTCFVSTLLICSILCCVCTARSLIRTMFFASPHCLLFVPLLSHASRVSTILLHPYWVSQESPVFRSALLANSYLSTALCDLGKVRRITTQSMLLINHVSYWSTTEVQEPGSGQTRYCLLYVNCWVTEVLGLKLEIWPIAHKPTSH